jgi:hypothetical protein
MAVGNGYHGDLDGSYNANDAITCVRTLTGDN